MVQALRLCVISLFIISAPIYAQTTVVWGMLDREYPPFIIHDGDIISGIDYDLTVEAFKRMQGYDLNIKQFPVARLPKEFDVGHVDFIYSYKAQRWEKSGSYLSHPLRWSGYRILTLPDKYFSYNNMKDLSKKSIGIVKAVPVSLDFYQAEQEGSLTLVRVAGFGALVKMLMKGRIDAVLSNPDIMRAYAKQANQDLVVLSTRPEPAKGYIGIVSAQSPLANDKTFKQLYTHTLQQMYTDGTYQNIARRYGVDLEFNKPTSISASTTKLRGSK